MNEQVLAFFFLMIFISTITWVLDFYCKRQLKRDKEFEQQRRRTYL